MKTTIFTTLLVMCILLTTNAQSYEENSIGLNSDLSTLMLDQNQDLRKLDLLLDAKSSGLLDQNRLNLGFSIVGIMDYQHATQESKFGYLMRHPTANNQRATDVSEAALHSAQLGITGKINSWITFYGELLYNPMQNFGQGTITSIGRNLFQLRKGIILIADPDKSPFYLALGKMDGNFGDMGSVSPFTNSTMWHAYGTLAFGATVGYRKNGINLSAMLIQGGAQFRSANVPVDGTSVPSQLNNFAFDGSYTFDLGNATSIKVGASYQKGTAYCQAYPVVHFMPCETHNPAFTFYGNVTSGKLKLMGGFASTTDIWPGTANPVIPEFEPVKVTSLVAGASYHAFSKGDADFVLSGEFSNFLSGEVGSPWRGQDQIIIGFSAYLNGQSRLFVEGLRVKGYAPLNFISGGNFDDPSETHSRRDVHTTGVVVGAVLML